MGRQYWQRIDLTGFDSVATLLVIARQRTAIEARDVFRRLNGLANILAGQIQDPELTANLGNGFDAPVRLRPENWQK